MSTLKNGYPPNGLSPTALRFPEWIQLGLGDKEYFCPERNAIFLSANPQNHLPDISNHLSYMAEILRLNSELYTKLKGKKTELGVTLADCIKPGIDNPGHALLTMCGIVAGDEESYRLFSDIFEPVVRMRHGGYTLTKIYQSDTNIERLNFSPLETHGRYVLTCRVRCARSIRGYRLPPVVKFEERRSIEKVVIQALLNLMDVIEGDYFPLNGSRSYDRKPNGMSREKETELRSFGILFQEPDNTMILSSGTCRHWPDARGIFINRDQNTFVWTNEEDHLRVISMEKGTNMRAALSRTIKLTKALEMELTKTGKEFMFDSRLGFISASPSNVGTGMRIGCLMRIPCLSSRSDFKTILQNMGLQARSEEGVYSTNNENGIVDVSNACRIGKSEVEYANMVFKGVLKIVKLEKKLELGDKIDHCLDI